MRIGAFFSRETGQRGVPCRGVVPAHSWKWGWCLEARERKQITLHAAERTAAGSACSDLRADLDRQAVRGRRGLASG